MVVTGLVQTRREEDEAERARIEQAVSTSLCRGTIRGPASTKRERLAVPLNRARIVNALLRNDAFRGTSMTLDSSLDAFSDRGVALVDDSGDDILLWMRPNVDRFEGGLHAKHSLRPYPDVARISLQEQGETSEVVLSWELHPKTVTVRQVAMIGGLSVTVVAAILALGTGMGLIIPGLVALIGLYAAASGFQVERSAWDPWPKVVEALERGVGVESHGARTPSPRSPV